MLSGSEMLATIKACTFHGLEFRVILKGSYQFLQVVDPKAECVENYVTHEAKGRKWYLSPHMTKSELVQTVFKAVLTFQEHEAREWFRYNGVPVCNPHLDLDHVVLSRRTAPEDTGGTYRG